MTFTRVFLLMGVLAFAACGDDDDDNGTDRNGQTDDEPTLAAVATCPPAGAESCGDGTEADGDNCQYDGDDAVTVNGTAVDFLTNQPKPNAIVNLVENDDGEPTGICGVTDNNGQISLRVPRGEVLGVATVAQGAKNTWQFNLRYPSDPTDGASSVDTTFISVSNALANLIPGLTGVEPDPEQGSIAGSVVRPDGSPVNYTGGTVATQSGEEAYYFDDTGSPTNRETQPELNPNNGLFAILNVPPGAHELELSYNGNVSDTTNNTLVTFPDSVAISNIVCTECP